MDAPSLVRSATEATKETELVMGASARFGVGFVCIVFRDFEGAGTPQQHPSSGMYRTLALGSPPRSCAA
jgi:hypothetical protein